MAKIIGIGNALVDVIVNIPEESLLQEFGLPKGGMEMINVEKKRQIHERISTMKQVRATGGSTSNTIHGIAHLGGETGYIGKVGNDEGFWEKWKGQSRYLNAIFPLDMP